VLLERDPQPQAGSPVPELTLGQGSHAKTWSLYPAHRPYLRPKTQVLSSPTAVSLEVVEKHLAWGRARAG
jgi:hypothetical protein